MYLVSAAATLTIFTESSILDIWQGSKYAFGEITYKGSSVIFSLHLSVIFDNIKIAFV